MNKKISLLLICILLFIALPLGAMIGAYYYFSYGLPHITSLKDYRPPLVSQVFSSNGELIGEFSIEKRYLAGLDDIAPVMIQAIIAAEDDRFFEHGGINLWSIVRAAVKNLRSFQIRQGGSTITQQIVKSLLLTPERSFSRKIKEAILATRIEKSLSKDEILNMYLNQIYFGRGAYGIEAAARVFFGKSARGLTLAESSYLAGLPKAPTYYSKPEHARVRQRYVLQRMVKQGYISAAEMAAAADAELLFAAPEHLNLSIAPYFVEYVRRELEKKYGADFIYNEGLRIETTLNTESQRAANRAVADGVSNYEAREKPTDNSSRVQAALVSINPYSGHIHAMVGGRDYAESQFNRVLQARRQPGSAFKPIIYAAALDKGYTPASVIVDSPLVYEVSEENENGEKTCNFWEPQNYDKRFLGPITFRQALTHSRNIVTIKILREIGIDYVVRYGQRLGADGEYNHDLSLSLGTCGVPLLNIVKAYSAFCAGGVYAEPVAITRILDRDGNVLEENRPQLISAISRQTAYIMTTLLQSVVEEGTGRRVRALHRPCAGKTGTTNDVRDAWFIGFTPDVVTGVWVGFDDLRPLGKHETGAVAAAPIWLDYMQTVLEGEPVQSFRVPEGIVFVRINPDTGFFPQQKTEPAIFECFKEGTQPTRFTPPPIDPLADR